jgi:hypothetical protein
MRERHASALNSQAGGLNIRLQIVWETPAEFLPLSLVPLVLFLAVGAAIRARLAVEILATNAADIRDCLLLHLHLNYSSFDLRSFCRSH